jgi:hypothetical protein
MLYLKFFFLILRQVLIFNFLISKILHCNTMIQAILIWTFMGDYSRVSDWSKANSNTNLIIIHFPVKVIYYLKKAAQSKHSDTWEQSTTI